LKTLHYFLFEQQRTYTFRKGPLGIKCDWETGFVKAVEKGKQAHELGVEIGWTISKVGDLDYSKTKLIAAKNKGFNYTVTFNKVNIFSTCFFFVLKI
jgi:hypothetical protein